MPPCGTLQSHFSGTLYASIAFDFVTSPKEKDAAALHCKLHPEKAIVWQKLRRMQLKSRRLMLLSIHPDHCFATAAFLHSSACKLLTRNPVCTGCNSAHTSHPVQFSLHQCNFSRAQCTGNMAAQCRWCAIFYLHGHWRSMLVIVWCSLTSCSWLQSWRLQYQQCDNLPSVWMNIMRIEG